MMILHACRKAAQEQLVLIEPHLHSLMYPQGCWFFDLFDFDYFVENTKRYFKVVRHTQLSEPDIIVKGSELFDNEMLLEEKKNREHIPYIDALEVAFYTGLRLTQKYNEIVDALERKIVHPYAAIHLRIEDDWPRDTQPYDCGVLYLSKEKVVEKFVKSTCASYKNIFLATAYDRDDLFDPWRTYGYVTHTHGKNLGHLNYLELSLIDFEVCVRADLFIGNNEASFSNLVVHTRHLLGKDQNYSYNSKDDQLYPRTDYGLHLRRNICKFADIKNYSHSLLCPVYKTYCNGSHLDAELQRPKTSPTPWIKDRVQLLGCFPKKIKVAEIGVQAGEYSESLFRVLEPEELYLIDCWQVLEDQEDPVRNYWDQYYWNQAAQDRYYSLVREKFVQNSNVKVIKEFSSEAARVFPDEYFDLIYIDANHTYKSVSEDLETWFPKVKKGGILAGHDYFCNAPDMPWTKFFGVVPAVNEFVKKHNLSIDYITAESVPSYAIIVH
jgi:hypothetical protein